MVTSSLSVKGGKRQVYAWRPTAFEQEGINLYRATGFVCVPRLRSLILPKDWPDCMIWSPYTTSEGTKDLIILTHGECIELSKLQQFLYIQCALVLFQEPNHYIHAYVIMYLLIFIQYKLYQEIVSAQILNSITTQPFEYRIKIHLFRILT